MREIWNKIENYLNKNAPNVLESLQQGATDEEIKEAEDFIGITFPEDFKESYKIHNGQCENQYLNFIGGQEFLSLNEIMGQWKIWKDLVDSGDFNGLKSNPIEESIKDDWYNPKWIPITHNGAGDHYCIDLDPNEESKSGQIISFWHDFDERRLASEGFKKWLIQFADDLENNKYNIDPEYGLEIE